MNIEEKTKLAHEWSMWFLDKNKDMAFAPNTVAYNAWEYADAMEVEAEKRIKEQKDKIYDPMRNVRTKQEWQPDWSVAPDWANYWIKTSGKSYAWLSDKPSISNIVPHWNIECIKKQLAPNFNYQGDWKDSLRKRPDRKSVPPIVETPPIKIIGGG